MAKRTTQTKAKKPAKAKAKAKAAPDGGERASEEYVPLIKPSVLKSLLRTDGSIRDDISELTGSLREKIAYAVSSQNLDKDAFALLKKFAKMKPEKRAALYREFNAYLKICGYLDDIEARPELPLEEEADDDGNVAHPQFGGTVRQLAEGAGIAAE